MHSTWIHILHCDTCLYLRFALDTLSMCVPTSVCTLTIVTLLMLWGRPSWYAIMYFFSESLTLWIPHNHSFLSAQKSYILFFCICKLNSANRLMDEEDGLILPSHRPWEKFRFIRKRGSLLKTYFFCRELRRETGWWSN